MQNAREHLGAFLVAVWLVAGLHIQDWNLVPLIGPVNDAWFRTYQTIYPGASNLDKLEVFSPEFRHTKKIILLGSSAAESLGADGTWHHPDPSRTPERNAAFECTIAHQMNRLLKGQGYGDWRVFSLARNGSRLTSALYFYARVQELQPELVIFADSEGYYSGSNAGAADLKSSEYAFIDSVVQHDSQAEATWQSYLTHLEHGGWQRPPMQDVRCPKPYPLYVKRDALTVCDLLEWLFIKSHELTLYEKGPVLPVETVPFVLIHHGGKLIDEVVAQDSEHGYLQGTSVITRLQALHHGDFLFLVLPRSELVGPNRRVGWDRHFGRYIESHGGHYSSELVDLDLKPILETYDGAHQTIYGNQRIAAGILKILRDQQLLRR